MRIHCISQNWSLLIHRIKDVQVDTTLNLQATGATKSNLREEKSRNGAACSEIFIKRWKLVLFKCRQRESIVSTDAVRNNM